MVSYSRGSGNYKSSNVIVVRSKADQDVTSSETMVNHLTLKTPLKVNRAYSGLLMLNIIAHATPKMDITFTDITGALYDTFCIGAGGALQNQVAFGSELALAADGGNETVIIYFQLITGSTAGDLQFQFAQTTSDANTTRVHNGSMLTVYDGGPA